VSPPELPLELPPPDVALPPDEPDPLEPDDPLDPEGAVEPPPLALTVDV
jgi:hypothetical protein